MGGDMLPSLPVLSALLLALLSCPDVGHCLPDSRISCPNDFPCRCHSIRVYVERAVTENRIDCRDLDLNAVPSFNHVVGLNVSLILLGYNALRELPQESFRGVTLRNHDPMTSNHSLNPVPNLDLSHNPLRRLTGDEFRDLRVEDGFSLNLNNCSLVELPVIAASVARQVLNLYLGYNDIRVVTEEAMRPFTSLVSLDLSGNENIHLRDDAFFHQGNVLSVLAVEDASLTSFPAVPVSGLRKLRDLFLGDNRMAEIPDYFMDNMSCSFLTLRLQRNNLSEISPNAFRRSSAMGHEHGDFCILYEIHLSQNGITRLDFLDDPCSLAANHWTAINVGENPLLCDCGLYNVTSYKLLHLLGTCAAPAVVSGLDIGWTSTEYNTAVFPDLAVSVCDELGRADQYYACDCGLWLNQSLGITGKGGPEKCPKVVLNNTGSALVNAQSLQYSALLIIAVGIMY